MENALKCVFALLDLVKICVNGTVSSEIGQRPPVKSDMHVNTSHACKHACMHVYMHVKTAHLHACKTCI
jgi:hypothetical protein